MTATSKIIVYVSVGVVCFAVIMTGILSRTRKNRADINHVMRDVPGMKGKEKNPQNPFPNLNLETQASENTKPGKKSWANTFLPFYSLGILAYIMFIVGKIMKHKYSGPKKEKPQISWTRPRAAKGRGRTKITMFEIQQLEERLQQTEKAMQEILSKSHSIEDKAAVAIERNTDSSDDEYLHTFPKRPKTTFEKVANDAISTSSSPVNSEDDDDMAMSLESENEESTENVCPAPLLRKRRVKKAASTACDTGSFQFPKPNFDFGGESSNLSQRIGRNEQTSQPSPSEQNSKFNSMKKDSESDDGDVEEQDQQTELLHDKSSSDVDDGIQLLKTAKNIQDTMVEIRGYLDEKKSNYLESMEAAILEDKKSC